MSSQQHAFDGDAQLPGQLVESVRHISGYGHRMLANPSAGRDAVFTSPPGQPRGADALELTGPEPARVGRIDGGPLEGDEIAELRGRCGGLRIDSAADRPQVEADDLGEHRGHAPAVEDGVMLAPGELNPIVCPAMHVEPEQRRLAGIDVPGSLAVDPRAQAPLLCGLVEAAEILDHERYANVSGDELQRLAVAGEIKP